MSDGTFTLPGEGDRKIVERTRVRIECEECGEPATKKHTYLLPNARRNPASSAYGKDDCSWCSDHEAFTCGVLDSLGKGVRTIAPAAHRSGGATPLSRQEPSQPSGRSSHIAGARLERCDYCGCSRHACGCEERFDYEDVRDNPTIFAR